MYTDVGGMPEGRGTAKVSTAPDFAGIVICVEPPPRSRAPVVKVGCQCRVGLCAVYFIVRCNSVRNGAVGYSLVRLGTAWCGRVQLGKVVQLSTV